MRSLAAVALALVSAAVVPAATLQIYAIDVEGGQATLLVTPTGDSLLIDAGWPGHNGRDADRILAAAKAAHVKKIDWLLVTHFHIDHVGGVYQLAQKIPIVHFVDHGSSVEKGKDAQIQFNEYAVRARQGPAPAGGSGRHHPGRRDRGAGGFLGRQRARPAARRRWRR